MGHTKIPFCLQSCVKPLTYAISVSTLGTDYVHKFVGKEPSGLRYNKLSLNEEGERLQGARLVCLSLSPTALFSHSLPFLSSRSQTQARLASEWNNVKQTFVRGQQTLVCVSPGIPHNPMVNAGAIVVSSLIKVSTSLTL